MPSFKRILKYVIYFFVVGWMFVLGIMVGRGNVPVPFDTRQFQTRLETIASEFGKKEAQQKVELKFYKVLEKPDSQDVTASFPQTGAPENIPAKTSLKKETFKKHLPLTQAQPSTGAHKAPEKKGQHSLSEKTAPPTPTAPAGRYTVQIASFKNKKDAEQEILKLRKKGIEAYPVESLLNGTLWHRVRTGPFATYDQAQAYQKTLGSKKIQGMIYKTEQ